jgi:hypothetical protein
MTGNADTVGDERILRRERIRIEAV